MTLTKILPLWYGGGIGNNRNVVIYVGHLTRRGFIFPKILHYEYNNSKRLHK